MAKPIFIIKFPKSTSPGEVIRVKEQISNVTEIINDYYVLVLRDVTSAGEIKFECFNSDLTDIQFQELEMKVFNIINPRRE